MCRSSGAALYTFFKQASAAVQVVEFPSPFKRFKALVRSVRMYIKASPLGGVRKITPLTQGQIIRTVESMYVRRGLWHDASAQRPILPMPMQMLA